jgi:hypothetical protein
MTVPQLAFGSTLFLVHLVPKSAIRKQKPLSPPDKVACQAGAYHTRAGGLLRRAGVQLQDVLGNDERQACARWDGKRQDVKGFKAAKKVYEAVRTHCGAEGLAELDNLIDKDIVLSAVMTESVLNEHFDKFMSEHAEKAAPDPIQLRAVLEAKAYFNQVSGRMGALIDTLIEIKYIDENRLKDPVTAARTVTRLAEAYLGKRDTDSVAAAIELLNHWLAEYANINANRTKVEMLLVLAQAYLRQGNEEACKEQLEGKCRQLLDDLKQEAGGSSAFPVLRADFTVRLGVALKKKESWDAAMNHLIEGALLRADLGNWWATAHAIHHIGLCYYHLAVAKTPGLAVPDGMKFLKRSLWLHLSALKMFGKSPRNPLVAQTHKVCEAVLAELEKIGSKDPKIQRREMQSFVSTVQTGAKGNEANLLSKIISNHYQPDSDGDLAFAQPFAEARKMHCSRFHMLCEVHELDASNLEREIFAWLDQP